MRRRVKVKKRGWVRLSDRGAGGEPIRIAAFATIEGSLRLVSALLLAGTAFAIGFDPDHAAQLLMICLVLAVRPLYQAWRSARGTALRPPLIWVALAVVMAVVAQWVALGEPNTGGRPITGVFTYLSVLAMLAALLSVLNARNPGGRVWAGLMVMLVVVFLIPWLETPGRLRRTQALAPPNLESPWTLFYGVLVLIGVTNYLPTRFGAAAAWLGLGFILEYLGLTRWEWPAERRSVLWLSVSWTLAMSLWTARWSAERAPSARERFERLWFWFRDHWGVVWALRIQERFNREAEVAKWPVVLTWFGLVPVHTLEPDAPLAAPVEAEATLRSLIRRFAQPWRLDDVTDSFVASSCDRVDAGP
jgi:hypothetical protein